jgi:hypothetical protein
MLFYATNGVSMDALFALEVQFFMRRSGKLFKDATETGKRQPDSSFGRQIFDQRECALRA